MKKLVILVALITVLLNIVVMPVMALSIAPPESFEIISEDQTRVFRFYGYVFCEESGYYRFEHEDGDERAAIYTNTEPRQLVYTINHFRRAWLGLRAYFSNDMSYFVSSVTCSSGRSQSLVFYAYGEVVRTYSRHHLLNNPDAETRRREMDFARPYRYNWSITNFDAESNELTIRTDERRTVVFDIETGEIILDNQGFFIDFAGLFARFFRQIMAIVIVAIIAVSIGMFLQQQNKGKKA
ncbi:MAG: hypothetical protein FWE06_06360 [Oscillospiraceae bacterium]|nr:hypothetical protein [Oscillospiraceae bacterium]